ncbi:hypothetical protein [Primorskyibacter sedentarius]|uniref:Excalibur calcium-binding domain-containing protein n=2 Tax=Primorskyibacter sedentarius TaxID=745311 RepID=A0A4R3JK73_9RHOB|nr:hypothetical protein EDD52_103160 [Primorskyibacter sedentarius]
MRFLLGGAALAALVACTPPIPDSGAGVGLDNYTTYEERLQRDAALENSTVSDVSVQTSTPNSQPDAIDAARAALSDDDGAAANSGQVPVNASPANAPPQVVTNSVGISDENDFNAVSDERSIESDAALIARNRAQYEVIQPTALPTRSGASGPNIVAYALQTTNPKGAQLYKRFGLNSQAKFQRNCASYASADLAQEDFLALGGPEKDRKGLDPDGDGFACAWDPAPFRKVRSGS